ncbi:MAG: molybdate ABC transporter substrate-binding protein [Chloroflexi bacterium]|nr:MAG: molybdate ABC transporter substrate-binding protein [Chloroflexota bacterium]
MPARFAAAPIGIAILLAACASGNAPGATASAVSGSITVFAASSLTNAFTRIGADFEKAHPGAMVHFNFAGSSTLVAQIQQGAIGDVFASADQPTMQKLVDTGLVSGPPSVFARNHLQIVVAAGNPRHVNGLADLSRPGLVVVLCAPAVPCGRYAGQALRAAAVTVRPASQETEVKAVVSKVALGEADAGIVYVTDVKAAGAGVQGVEIPARFNVTADYPIAVLKDSQDVGLARAFIGYVLANGQETLGRDGFASP